MEETTFHPRTDFFALHQGVNAIREQIGKVIIGQHEMVDLLITGLLTQGHVLIEGVPGVAKTLTAKLLARCIDADFSRLQFTPDIMPADVLGTSVFNPDTRNFEYKRGPVFSNLVLIDEINRAPAKTQAALFEVMEERQITNDGISHPLPAPFMVVATQNPIEQEGTYRLPEAQLDRFLFKIEVKYPSLNEEITMLHAMHRFNGLTDLTKMVDKVVTARQIIEFQAMVRSVHIEDKLLHYIAALTQETRVNASLYLGASPRASIAVMNCAKATAAINNRDFVTPDDIVNMLPHVLRHRIMLTPEREMEGITTDEVIAQIIKAVEVPR
ncbi:AAA family ATPase [Chitinophaga sancti]|uniref:MoxR family ATPase n=1 Tax=Chitinophaga sancti TaxID=1004 RepID=A0A1K1QBE3_9BACT|nr:MoxR family ATPase [Chitinophaga sancti]WQD61340.1 MoxR family ATPase [Chitinophaga sancti]WQG93107.1 MoxR family ATPase [Chitinophaga sancti]SFW57239.1 MoxR-like ATPase [Chitinophaga sancti]